MQKVDTKTIRDSLSITSNPRLLKAMVDYLLTAYKSGQKSLSQSLLSEFEAVFGPPNKTLRLEKLTKVWVIEFNGLCFNLFTAKGKGTSIEVCGLSYEALNTGEHEAEIQTFLVELYTKINEVV